MDSEELEFGRMQVLVGENVTQNFPLQNGLSALRGGVL